MKKSEYRGFTQVFSFTFMQAVRSKSLQVTTLIMVLAALLVFPVLNRDKKPDEDYESPVNKVYVINESGMENIPYSEAFKDETGYGKVIFEETGKKIDTLTKEIEENHSDEIVLKLSLSMETGTYQFDFYRDPESEVEYDDVADMAYILTKWFEKYKVSILDADEATLEMVGKVVDFTYMDSGEYLETDEHEIISDADYNVVYAFLMVVYMVVIMASGMVSSKVVEEKANRVVEYLMTTVRPMALVLGKVVAMLSVTVGEIALIAVAAFVSNKVAAVMYGTKSSIDALSGFMSTEAISNLSAGNIIICILMIAIGILIYGLLAGLFGASVSKMEDLQQGIKAYTFLILICFFMSMAACEMMWTVGINGFVRFCMIFPFTSVMILPGAILIGKATIATIVVAVVLQVVTAVIVLKIVSMVYETIIVMNGNPVSVKQMIDIIRRR
ncbi:MAG: ABC transporter permease [Lachnospiraceae bacterium]